MVTTKQKVGAAILLADSQWNRKTATESWESVVARSAIEAITESNTKLYDIIYDALKYPKSLDKNIAAQEALMELRVVSR